MVGVQSPNRQEVIMPQAPRKTSVAQSEIPTALRNLIVVYLAVSVGAIALLLFGGDPSSGIFLVLFALPWSLFVNQISGLIGIDSAALNLALLAIGVGINAALLYLLGRRLRRRQ
jgi:O-antigen/teichoic acid export membrane protein